MKDAELPRVSNFKKEAERSYRADLGYKLPNNGKLRIRNLDLRPFDNKVPSLAQLAAYLSGLSLPDTAEKTELATGATNRPPDALSASLNDEADGDENDESGPETGSGV